MGCTRLLIHATTAKDAAGILHRNASVRFGKDYYYQESNDNNDNVEDNALPSLAPRQNALLNKVWQPGYYATEYYNRYTIAYPIFSNKFTQPYAEHGTSYHRYNNSCC